MYWTYNKYNFHYAKFLYKCIRCNLHTWRDIDEVIHNFVSFKNRPLPKLTWIKSSNATHGYIQATADFSVGPKPISAIGYHARTLNNKRFDFVEKLICSI